MIFLERSQYQKITCTKDIFQQLVWQLVLHLIGLLSLIFIFYILLLKHLSTHFMFKHNKLLQRSITKYTIALALNNSSSPAMLNSTIHPSHLPLPAAPTPAPPGSFAGPVSSWSWAALAAAPRTHRQLEVNVPTPVLSPQCQDTGLSLCPCHRDLRRLAPARPLRCARPRGGFMDLKPRAPHKRTRWHK